MSHNTDFFDNIIKENEEIYGIYDNCQFSDNDDLRKSLAFALGGLQAIQNYVAEVKQGDTLALDKIYSIANNTVNKIKINTYPPKELE